MVPPALLNIYRVALDNIPGIGLLVFDPDMRFVLAVGSALSLHGYFPEQILNKTLRQVVGDKEYVILCPLYENTLAGQPQQFHLTRGRRTYYVQMIPLRRRQRVTHGLIIISETTPLEPGVPNLTAREQQVYRQLLSKKTNEEICAVLNITSSTLKRHCRNVFRKAGVKNRIELMATRFNYHPDG